MKIIISNNTKEPIYQQIKNQIKKQILDGTIRQGENLPSIRALAKDIKVSVITTKRAYDDLEKEGFIASLQGKGTFALNHSEEFIEEKKVSKIYEFIEELKEKAEILGVKKSQVIKILDEIWKEN